MKMRDSLHTEALRDFTKSSSKEKDSDKALLLPIEHLSSNDSDISPVWIRINAFLDLKSKNTQRTYIGIIKEWCEFLGAPAGSNAAATAFLNASDLHAMAYRKWLERQPGQSPRHHASQSKDRALQLIKEVKQRRDGLQSTQANATIAKKFTVLRRLYRMLIAADLGIRINPFDSDRVPAPSAKSGQKRPTEMLDFSLVETVLDQPDLNTPKGIRDKAALSLLFGGGLRRSEVTALKLCDICKSPSGTTYLHLRATKNRKDADQTIPDWAAEALFALLEQRLAEGAEAADPLFISYRGRTTKRGDKNQLTPNGLYKVFKKYCIKAGAGMFITPHSARATAITKLLSDGIGHREVQEFSRHSSIQMVEIYDKRRYTIEQSPAKNLNYK